MGFRGLSMPNPHLDSRIPPSLKPFFTFHGESAIIYQPQLSIPILRYQAHIENDPITKFRLDPSSTTGVQILGLSSDWFTTSMGNWQTKSHSRSIQP